MSIARTEQKGCKQKMERRNYSREHEIGKKYFRKRRINRENTEQ